MREKEERKGGQESQVVVVKVGKNRIMESGRMTTEKQDGKGRKNEQVAQATSES